MMRPVRNLRCNEVEHIGTFEQVYMNIAIEAKEFIANHTTHMEMTKQDFLSIIASLTPFSGESSSGRKRTARLKAVHANSPRDVVPPLHPQTLTSRRVTCTSARWASRPWAPPPTPSR